MIFFQINIFNFFENIDVIFLVNSLTEIIILFSMFLDSFPKIFNLNTHYVFITPIKVIDIKNLTNVFQTKNYKMRFEILDTINTF